MGYKRICGIYCIENLISHKKYIGQSINIKQRWHAHRRELNKGTHDNDYLQKAWNKDGEENFKFYILEKCQQSELDEKERYYIKLYNTLNKDYGYNLKDGGQDHEDFRPEETREKVSKALKETYANTDLKEIRRKQALEQWADPEIRAKHCGEHNGIYGTKRPDNVRQALSKAHKGKPSWRRDQRPVFCIELNQIFENCTIAGQKLGFDGSRILQVCYGNRKTTNGYHWKFASEEE